MNKRQKAAQPVKAKRWIAVHANGEACQISFKTRERGPLKEITEEFARRVSRCTDTRKWKFYMLSVTLQCMAPTIVIAEAEIASDDKAGAA